VPHAVCELPPRTAAARNRTLPLQVQRFVVHVRLYQRLKVIGNLAQVRQIRLQRAFIATGVLFKTRQQHGTQVQQRHRIVGDLRGTGDEISHETPPQAGSGSASGQQGMRQVQDAKRRDLWGEFGYADWQP